jgi:hypothetical protein
MTLDGKNSGLRDVDFPTSPELDVAKAARNSLAADFLALLDKPVPAAKAPVETEQSLDFNGTKLTLKTRDGKAVYFKEGADEWDSKDGELWIRRGSNGVGTWRGKVAFDDKGNYVEEGLSFGTKTIRRTDGSSTTSITNKNGDDLSLTKFADGKCEFKGTSGQWKSDDGRNWHNGDKTYVGSLGIDSFGRYWRQASTSDAVEFADRSSENNRIVEKMSAMEKKYNVSFGQAGREVEYEYRDPEQDKYVKVQVAYRYPTSAELNVLEKSLDQYAHLAATADRIDFKGLRFNFISSAAPGDKVSLYGWYNSQKEGISQVSFGPRNSLQPADAWEGLKGTALHEIAHHLQYQLWTKGPTRETPQSVLDAFGFSLDAASGNYRLKDKDGAMWQRDEVRKKDKETGKWEYYGRWYPVVSGTVVKEESRARTTKQMHDSLPTDRKPCTNYFTYPTEAHAEALSMYLFDRRMLWERNFKLYESTKQWDQGDINRRYGMSAANPAVPAAIRGVDGTIIANTPEARAKVEAMEKGWRNKPASTSQLFRWDNAITTRDRFQDERYEERL